MFYRPGVGLSAYRRLVAVAEAWSDVWRSLTSARPDTCSCKQCENLVAPLSGGAGLEEAAAWEAKQMEAARHAKEPLLAEVERLSAARAKGKKGKKKKKNVGVGDTGAARLNEEMLCS